MTKYYRRAGTIAYRYIIQAEIEKIELKVPTAGPYPQRYSVILKRGDVLRETKNASLVEGGIAYFNEKLSLPATIYYDTRKKAYLQKEATLAVNVYSKRATKLMGVTKFDLAPFINQNIKEQNIVLKMDKCSDKNAKYFLKISMNQIMELGASKRSSRHSFKDMTRNSSIRASMKESQLQNVSEIEEHEDRIKEESKLNLQDYKEDDLYSYYTGSNSPTSQSKLQELEETMGDVVRTPPKATESDFIPTASIEFVKKQENFKLDSANKFYAFNPLESESPQKIETSLLENSQDEIELKVLEDKDDIIAKELIIVPNSLRNSNQSAYELRSEYEQLRKAYSALEQKYEITLKNQNNTGESLLKINMYESRILELEKRCRETEEKNDLLTRKVEELDQINTEYLTQIRGYVEQQNELKNIDSCDVTMKEMLQKLVEANNTMMKQEEIYILEKENAQKQIQALEQNIQRLKENEQYNHKQKPKALGTSFDNTGLYASFKTREESIIEDNEDASKFIPNDVTDRSHILDRSGIESSKLAEISALKQEIKDLNSKLSTAVNVQNKYEEEVQKKGLAEQELKSLKKELDKANKGWSYAEEERYELAGKLKEYEDGSKMDKKVDMLETELFKMKVKLCEVMNLAMEFGRTDMLDKIENIMSRNELSDLRSSLRQSFWE